MTNGELKLEKLSNDLLDNFNDSLRLYKNTAPTEDINTLLSISTDEMSKYEAEQCLEISNVLMQYSFFLQRAINRESAKLKAVNSEIYRLCSNEWGSYDKYTPKDIRIKMIAKENQALDPLMKLATRLEMLIEEISGLSYITKQYAENWKEMGKVKTYGYK